MKEIKLGDKVKDSVTGFKGIAIAITEYLNGCERVTLQPVGVDKDGKTYDCETFDLPQVELMVAKKVKRKTNTGGPKPMYARKEININKPNI